MNQDNPYIDHEDIYLEVTLKSGNVYPEKLKCRLLRTFAGCDAHALIDQYDINGMKENGVEPADCSSFKDPQGRTWKIDNFEGHIMPKTPPRCLFYLNAVRSPIL